MAPKIKHKRSALANNPPTAGQIEAGELAINTNSTSANLHFEDDGGTVRSVGADPSAAGTYERNVATANGVGTWVVAGSQPPGNNAPYGHWDRNNASTTLSPRIAGDDIATTGNVLAGIAGNTRVDLNAANGFVRAVRSDGKQALVSGSNAYGLSLTDDLGSVNVSIDWNGDAMFAGDIQSTSQNGGQLAGFRNHLINGAFRVWQRGNDFSVVGGAGDAKYTADRWFAYSNTSAIGKYTTNAPDGFDSAIATKAGGESLPIRQSIELLAAGKPGPFTNGSTWTLTFWARGSGAGHVYDITVGFAQGSTTNPTTPLFLNVANEALTTTWTKYSHTFTIATAPNSADVSVNVTFALKNGSGFNYMTGIQLEPGPVATPFEHRPVGTELALCQRFYQTRSSGTVNAADLRPTMRATPTVSGNNYDAEL